MDHSAQAAGPAQHSFDLGNDLLKQGQWDKAADAFKRAVHLEPHYPEAYFHLGMVLRAVSTVAEAADAFATAVTQSPAYWEARYELANAYRHLNRLGDAEREIRIVVRQRPDFAKGHSALGVILTDSGRPADGVAAFAEAMRIDPHYMNAATNWVNTQQYIPSVTEQSLAAANAKWVALHAPATPQRTFSNPRTTDRPLRIGFLSPDFGSHPVGFLSVRLFENLDRSLVSPFVFSTRPHVFEDDLSARIAGATNWSTVFGFSDADITTRITNSRIDILFDLSGHTANHRLKVFAQRAAPVQVSWLGYGGSAGVPGMDYFLANNQLTPAGAEADYTERIIRLPHWHACFDPPPDAPDVGPLPGARNGYITFGCLSNPAKISDVAIASFARIMARVPDSRLTLRYKSLTDPGVQDRLRTLFAQCGIAGERLDMAGFAPKAEFLATYNDIDIVLDTFPYSGCMTSCEATWMGCPVVTFPGATFAGRQTASILMAAGLNALVAKDMADFETLAVTLADDHGKLGSLRASLRAQVLASPVCDGPGFARDFTAAMRHIWATWCDSAASSP